MLENQLELPTKTHNPKFSSTRCRLKRMEFCITLSWLFLMSLDDLVQSETTPWALLAYNFLRILHLPLYFLLGELDLNLTPTSIFTQRKTNMNISKKLQKMLLTLALSVLFSAEASANVWETFDTISNTLTEHYTSLKGDYDTMYTNEVNAHQSNPSWTITEQQFTGSVPEIDASSGTSAITLLSGVLILALKRSRSRKDTKS